MSCKLVTIVVPCRNEVSHIENFINDVLRQELFGVDMEIIIADGASQDGTREIL